MHISRGAAEGKGFFARPSVHCLLVVAAGILVYANTLHVPFVFDDYSSIVDNPVIKDLANFLAKADGYRYNPRRFVGYLTFALNYRFGGLDVTGYHLVNLAVHLVTSLLVYAFSLLTLRTPRLKESRLVPRARLLALFAALLFAVHPVETQAVTYVVQRLASLCAMFYLVCLVFYIVARLNQIREGRAWSARTAILLAGSLLAALLAFGTKENAFTLPFALFLYEGIFFPLTRRKRVFLTAAAATGAAVVGVVVLCYGSSLGKLLSDVGDSLSAAHDIGRGEYLLTQVRVVATYVRLLFLPVRQNLDYAYPLAGSLSDPPVLWSLAFLLCLQTCAGVLLVRAGRGGDGGFRLVAFGIFWFFLALAVESSLIPIADVIFEHRLYLPSVGVFMALATLLFLIPAPGARIARGAFAAALVLLMIVTWQRNEVWRDGVTLWEDVIAKSPGKARPYNELGKVLFDAGRYAEAISSYRTAIRLQPDFFPAHNNLGAAYFRSGDVDGAMTEYLIALRLQPGQAEVHNNLGVAYDRKGMFDRATAELEAALKIRADYAAAYDNLGSVLRKMGRTGDAIASHRTALRLQPGCASAYNNLGIAYAEQGKLDEAMGCFQAAIALQPGSAEFHGNMAQAYDLRGWHERAVAERRKVGVGR